MENITRTIFGSYLQTCMFQRRPFVLVPSSTLNEKFGIAADQMPAANEIPWAGYFAIGNGGHRMSVGAGGVTKTEPVQHKATDAALYNHIPFVLREMENDLTVVERQQFALRRKESHGGRFYFAYYLKRIDLSNAVPAMEYITAEGGTQTVTPFVPDSSNLNPVPPEISPTGVNVTGGDYVSATSKNDLKFTPWDIQELLNVAKVLYDDDSYAIVSEIALCSGLDKVLQSPGVGNTTINFTEAIAVQVMTHINTFIPAKYSNQGTETLLDLGATEPLFALR
jgi:hypothetical protein